MDEPKILVAIRKRPLSKKEQSKGENDVVSVKNQQTVVVTEYKETYPYSREKVDLTKYLEEAVFNFDFAFNEDTSNEEIYDHAVRPLIDSAFQGAKVTCFAYGQTGSGKTFTMNGNYKMGVYGLYTLGANDIFAYLADSRFSHLTAKLSFFEIYCGKLFDLLNKRQELTLREDNKSNINIIGLEEIHIDNLDKFQELLAYGSTQRITSQNSANAESSRSHAILQVILKEGKKVYGKVSFIDLAGNERGADHTDMKKQTRIDGAEINKSLLSLKECIRALDQGKGHTPFRGSKLTMVLKDSFVGFCRTIMIGNVSPSSASSENTLNTLRYADRVKELRKPISSESKEEMRARELMLPRQNKNAIKINISNDDDAEDIEAKRKQAQKNYGILEESFNGRQMQREKSNDPYKKEAETDRGRQPSFGQKGGRPLGGKQFQQNHTQMNVNTQLFGQPKSPSVSNNNLCKEIRNPKRLSTNEKNIFHNNEPKKKVSTNNHKRESENNRTCPEDLSRVLDRKSNNFMGINGASTTNMSINNANFINNNHSNYSYGNGNNNGSQFFPNNFSQQLHHSQSNQNLSQEQFYQQKQVHQNHQNPFLQAQGQYQRQVYYQNNNQYANNPFLQNQYSYESYNQQNNHQDQNSNSHFNQQEYQKGQFRNSNKQECSSNQFSQFNNKLNQFTHQEEQRLQQVPEDFEGMIEYLSTTRVRSLAIQLRSKLLEKLENEENELKSNYKEILEKQLNLLKQEIYLVDYERVSLKSSEYISHIETYIDQKTSLFEELREKVNDYRYKLERFSELKNFEDNDCPGNERVRGEDEQLLDDLH